MTTAAAPATPAKSRKKAEQAEHVDHASSDSLAGVAPKSLKLPEALRSYHDQLVKALALPVPFTWDESVTYAKAEQAEAIASVLIRALHPDILNAKLAVVFRKKLADRDKTRLAQASKVGGKLAYFAELDLLIEVNHEQWRWLSAERRIALIDHELCHFTRNETEDGPAYAILSHDIEEFGAIVRRWGFWTQDVERFASAIEKARQLDIFAAPVEKASAPVAVN